MYHYRLRIVLDSDNVSLFVSQSYPRSKRNQQLLGVESVSRMLQAARD